MTIHMLKFNKYLPFKSLSGWVEIHNLTECNGLKVEND